MGKVLTDVQEVIKRLLWIVTAYGMPFEAIPKTKLNYKNQSNFIVKEIYSNSKNLIVLASKTESIKKTFKNQLSKNNLFFFLL